MPSICDLCLPSCKKFLKGTLFTFSEKVFVFLFFSAVQDKITIVQLNHFLLWNFILYDLEIGNRQSYIQDIRNFM